MKGRATSIASGSNVATAQRSNKSQLPGSTKGHGSRSHESQPDLARRDDTKAQAWSLYWKHSKRASTHLLARGAFIFNAAQATSGFR